MKVKIESEVAQSCLTLSDAMDCSRPGSSTHGIFQARVLEWGAIAFSNTITLRGRIFIEEFGETQILSLCCRVHSKNEESNFGGHLTLMTPTVHLLKSMFDVPTLFPLYFKFHEGKDSLVLVHCYYF